MAVRRPGPAALLLVLALAVAACTRDTLNDPGEHGTATPPATTQTTHTPTPAPSTTTQPPVQATTTPPDAWPFGLGDAHCTEHEIERDQVSGVLLRDGVGVFGWVTDPGLPKEGWVSVFEETRCPVSSEAQGAASAQTDSTAASHGSPPGPSSDSAFVRVP